MIKTQWNADIVDELERGAIHKLKEFGVKKIITVIVPGAVEIPFTIKNYWEHSKEEKKDQMHLLHWVV